MTGRQHVGSSGRVSEERSRWDIERWGYVGRTKRMRILFTGEINHTIRLALYLTDKQTLHVINMCRVMTK